MWSKTIFWGRTEWGAAPDQIAPKKTSFGPNFDIGEFYDRGGPCTRGPAELGHDARASRLFQGLRQWHVR